MAYSSVQEFVDRAQKGLESQPVFEERLLSARIRISGNLAQAWCRYDAKFGSEERLFTWSGVDAYTLMFHDGQWRVVCDKGVKSAVGFLEATFPPFVPAVPTSSLCLSSPSWLNKPNSLKSTSLNPIPCQSQLTYTLLSFPVHSGH